MILEQMPALYVQQDAELSLLRTRWNGGKSTQQLREASSYFVNLAQQSGARRLLLELDELPDVPVYDQLWLSTTLLPRAIQLPVRQLVVILSGRRIYNRHVVESLLKQFQNQVRCDIQFFQHAEPALEWLTDHSSRVPELVAEWEQGGSGLPEPSRQYVRP